MILISNTTMLIPSQERFIGYMGDDLTLSREFLITDYSDNDNYIYRLFLSFKNGESNFFTLSSQNVSAGVKLLWDVQKEHILDTGIVSAQLKVYENDGEIWHSSVGLFQVLESLETSSNFKTPTEFEQIEEKLNEMLLEIENASLKAPIIGENSNWYLYNSVTSVYEDTGLPSRGEMGVIEEGSVQTAHLEDGAVTEDKLSSEVAKKLNSGGNEGLKVYDVYSYNSIAEDKSISENTKNIIDDINKMILSIHRNYITRLSTSLVESYANVPNFIKNLSLEGFFQKNEFCFDRLVNDAYACFIKKGTYNTISKITNYEIYFGIDTSSGNKIDVTAQTYADVREFRVNENLIGNKMYKLDVYYTSHFGAGYSMSLSEIDTQSFIADCVLFKDNNYSNYYDVVVDSNYSNPEVKNQILILDLEPKNYEEDNYIVNYVTRNTTEEILGDIKIVKSLNGKEKIVEKAYYWLDDFWFYEDVTYPYDNNEPSEEIIGLNYFRQYKKDMYLSKLIFNFINNLNIGTETIEIILENIPGVGSLLSEIESMIDISQNTYIVRNSLNNIVGKVKLTVENEQLNLVFNKDTNYYVYSGQVLTFEINLTDNINMDFRSENDKITYDDMSTDLTSKYMRLPYNTMDSAYPLSTFFNNINEQGIFYSGYNGDTLIQFGYTQLYIGDYRNIKELKIRKYIGGEYTDWIKIPDEIFTGKLEELTTTDKTSLVNAINEVNIKDFTGTQDDWDILTEEQKSAYDIVYIYE